MTEPRPPRSLGATAAAVAARWPTLLAWFLAGWLARVLLIRLAGHLTNEHDPVWGLLVVPLAVLARLGSYVAIFLVVREVVLPGDPDRAPGRAAGARRFRETVLEAILPFFVIYAAWAIVDEDVLAYGRSTLDQVDFDRLAPGESPLTISFGVLSVSMVVVAFAVRQLHAWLADRLPRWSDVVAVYAEAAWVLVTVLVLRAVVAAVPDWLASRRMVAWSLDRLDELRAELAWVGRLVDGLGPAWSLVSDVVLLPLAWLALAGVVFAHQLSGRAVDDPWHVVRVRERVGRLPSRWRRVADWAGASLVERWEPVRRIGVLAWRAGALPVAAYLLAFAVVTAAPDWLRYAFTRVAGPHERGWWGGTDGLVTLGVDVVTVPLQLAVVAVALFRLSSAAERRAAAAAPPAPARTS